MTLPAPSRAVTSGNLARYKRGRLALIVALGGKCVDCGEADPDELQFDHTGPRTWVANKTSRWQRLAHYRREAAAGEIELRCGDCNNRKGKPAAAGSDEPIPE